LSHRLASSKARRRLAGLTWQALLKTLEFWFTEDLVAGR
jgi:hypothetical protein